jgi:hypothetical protein
MILHFSKWLKLVPLLDCNREDVIHAFKHMVFNSFGAPAKVFIDQDIEFCWEFQKLCEKTLIDHRTTS